MTRCEIRERSKNEKKNNAFDFHAINLHAIRKLNNSRTFLSSIKFDTAWNFVTASRDRAKKIPRYDISNKRAITRVMRHRFLLRVALQSLRKWWAGEVEPKPPWWEPRDSSLRPHWFSRTPNCRKREVRSTRVAQTVGNRSRVQQPGGKFTCAPAAESSNDGRIPRGTSGSRQLLPHRNLFDTKIIILRKKFSPRMKIK